MLTDLQHLEALYDEVDGRADIYNTFRAMLAGLMLGAAGGFIDIFAVPAAVALLKTYKAGDYQRAEEIQRQLNRCSRAAARKRSAIRHHQGHRVGRDRHRDGPARPPYMAPADAADRIRRRLPLLNEVI